MDPDVIEATAEALPLELLNNTNKELTAQISKCEEQLDDKTRGIDDQRKRLQFMKEHLGNVRAEIVNTQSLVESTKRELESESNMHLLMERECGRLQQRQAQLRRSEEELRDHIGVVEHRLFEKNMKIDEFKTAMGFNQEELEQWNEARRQKEDDELAVARYTKEDEARLRQLTSTIEKLEKAVRERRTLLSEEVMATHNVQIELDRCAADYRKLHDDRGGLLDEWEQVAHAMAEHDTGIQLAAERYAEGAEWIATRQNLKKDLDAELEEAREQMGMTELSIQEREKQAQQLRDAMPMLSRQVQEMGDEVEALREHVNRVTADRRSRLAQLQDTTAMVTKREEELAAVQGRRDAAVARMQRELAAAEDLQQQAALIAQIYDDSLALSRKLEKDIEQSKAAQFRANQELSAVRARQDGFLTEISGAQAQGKNVNARIRQLDAESFAQQGVLYSVEFSVQQMEKRVSRAKGERTVEERQELHTKIELLQSTLSELAQQHRVLDGQVKRVREEVRRSKVEIEKLEARTSESAGRVLELDLECGHIAQDSKKVARQREDALVMLDTMELQLGRLRRTLRQRGHQLVDLEERKRQLLAEVAERELEIETHHKLLKMEGKLAEEERKHLFSELVGRQRSLEAVRNRHAVLVGRMNPQQARFSQAQLVIAAAKERESLQYHGDSLDTRIRRIEKELLKLEKTLSVLKASNANYKKKFVKVSEDTAELATRRLLQEKHRDLQVVLNRRELERSDDAAALEAKQRELEQLSMERDHIRHVVRVTQQEYEQLLQEVLQAREMAVRFEQAVAKARGLVDIDIANDIELVETKARLEQVVRRLLQCAQRSNEEVYKAVRNALVAAHLPFDENS